MPDVPSLPRTTKLAERVAAVFDSGRLAESLSAFEVRPAQREMADAVAKTLDEGGVLLVEAGTGTGKTLAYLVPAILSGRRVLLSTGTKNLQEQIYFKDLPILRETLGIPFTATYMKGRGNYLCLHRFESFRASAEGAGSMRLFGQSATQVFLPIIERWAAETDTGDRAEIEDLPEDLPFWSDIAASSENCVGTECPRYQDCFVTKMRQRAADSDLVVVNHHLLCADAAVRQSAYGEVIPECQAAIVDEAHQLEDVATQYFGVAVSNYRFEELSHDGERLIASGAAGASADDLRHVLDRMSTRAEAFFAALSGGAIGATQVAPYNRGDNRGGGSSESRVRITSEALQPVYEDGLLLVGALDHLEATAALIKPPADPERKPGDPSPQDPLSLSRRAGEQQAVLIHRLERVAGNPHPALRGASVSSVGRSFSCAGALAQRQKQILRTRAQSIEHMLQIAGARAGGARGDEPLAVAGELLEAIVAHCHAEVLGGHVLQLVRLVHDRHLAVGNHLAVRALAHRGVRAEQVMIHHHQIGVRRALPHLRHEAVRVARALGAHAILGRGGDLAPERQIFRQVVDFGAIAGVGVRGPRFDDRQEHLRGRLAEQPHVPGAFRRGAERFEPMETEVVPPALHVGGRERQAERLPEDREILEVNLFLQVLRTR